MIGAIACPATTQYTAADDHGQLITFNPASPGGAKTTPTAGGDDFHGIACPSTSLCAAGDDGAR